MDPRGRTQLAVQPALLQRLFEQTRLTTAAGAEAMALGGLGVSEEDDAVTLGPPRGAGRTAVDARRLDGEHEAPVRAVIAGLHRPPPRLVIPQCAPLCSAWSVVERDRSELG
jgi:hypothetical protein